MSDKTTKDQPSYRSVDNFDRVMGMLAGLPDVTKTQPSTVTVVSPFLGATSTAIIQSMRHIDRDGSESRSQDFLFIQSIDSEGLKRIVLTHQAVAAILRQHDALATKVRRRLGREQAAARKARGELPAFMNGKGKGKRKGKKAKGFKDARPQTAAAADLAADEEG